MSFDWLKATFLELYGKHGNVYAIAYTRKNATELLQPQQAVAASGLIQHDRAKHDNKHDRAQSITSAL